MNHFTMTTKIISITCFVILTAVACKKEKADTKFTAEGYWTGKLYTYNAAILNRSNGTSRLYSGILGEDTAGAQDKLDGKYISTGDSFVAAYPIGTNDTGFLKAYKIEPLLMSGGFSTTTLPGANFPFEFKKINK